MDIDEFIRKMKQIEKEGFIESHRKGNTGIGKTLEDKLGITENNISGPDFGVYELKSSRRQSKTMVTLFTKTPSPKGAIKKLVENFGYQHRKESSTIPSKDKELHVTVDACKPNSVGLQLAVDNDRLCFENDESVQAYYDKDILKMTFEKKYCKMVFVIADCKKQGGKEFFHYNEAYKLEGFGFDTFTQLIQDGLLKVDLRVGHYPNGRVHDHGTAFRIMPNHFPMCFDKIERIL